MSGQPIENHGASEEGAEGQRSPIEKYGRRALMLGAAAGVGAAASLVAKPETASAQGTPVELGETNTATSTTEVSTSSGSGLYGQSVGPSGITNDLTAGVLGDSNTNSGVIGASSASDGIYGVTTKNGAGGVAAFDASPGGGYGVLGASSRGSGVFGSSIGPSGLADDLRVRHRTTCTQFAPVREALR